MCVNSLAMAKWNKTFRRGGQTGQAAVRLENQVSVIHGRYAQKDARQNHQDNENAMGVIDPGPPMQ